MGENIDNSKGEEEAEDSELRNKVVMCEAEE